MRASHPARIMASLLLIGMAWQWASAQEPLPLNDLSSFKNPGKTWQVAGNVTGDLSKDNELHIEKGTGILVNYPTKKVHGVDLFTNAEYADIDLELDYMMAKESNSGIYLQGRYELQLRDSWAKPGVSSGDNGGIYERWDEGRGKGNEGYDGHAPRQNVSRAPGLWQHLKVVFQAPRFNSSGQKVENARMLRVELNGVLIHENVELLGPTRGAMASTEAASGPLRIQGDHGAVAFRNITIKNFDKQRPELTSLKYKIYAGKFENQPKLDTLKPESEGSAILLTSTVNNKENEFLIHYTGTLSVKDAGEYMFRVYTSGGRGALSINNQQLKTFNDGQSKPISLQPGSYPLELSYSKYVSWERPALGLSIQSNDIREFLVSDPGALVDQATDPILVEAANNTIMRSFMDIPGGKRVVHAVNVGSSAQLHYTYDLDHGMLVQVWRGAFLDATPMWHDRGDGSSRPMGSKLVFGNPVFNLQKLSDPQQPFAADSASTGFVVKGYELDAYSNPSFQYLIHGAKVKDFLQVTENGQALKRTISVENNPGNLYIKVAEGKTIEPLSKGVYLVDDKSYYLRFDDTNVKPVIRNSGGKSEMIIPVERDVTYSILF